MSSTAVGAAAAAAAAVLFGTVFVATAFVLRSFEPVPGALWRAVAAFVMLAPIVLIGFGRTRRAAANDSQAGPPRPMRDRVLRALLIGLCGGPLFVAGINIAVAGAGATIAAFVTGMYAVFAALLAPVVLHELLKGRVLLGFVTALVGTALLSGLDPDPQFAGGFAAGIVAALIYGFYLTLGRRWGRAYALAPEMLTLSSTGTAIVLLFAWVAVAEPGTLVPTSIAPEALVALLWVAAAWAFGQILVQASVRRISAARSAAFLLLNPLTASALALLVLGERLSTTQALGAVLVLVGIALSAEVDAAVRSLLAGGRRRSESTRSA